MGEKDKKKREQKKEVRTFKTYSIDNIVSKQFDLFIDSLKKDLGVSVSASDVIYAFLQLEDDLEVFGLLDKLYAYTILSKELRKIKSRAKTQKELMFKAFKASDAFGTLLEVYKFCDALENCEGDDLKRILTDYIEFLKKHGHKLYGDFEKSAIHYTLSVFKDKIVTTRKPNKIKSLIRVLERLVEEIDTQKDKEEKTQQDELDITAIIKEAIKKSNSSNSSSD